MFDRQVLTRSYESHLDGVGAIGWPVWTLSSGALSALAFFLVAVGGWLFGILFLSF
jgi:hypothetical protein